MGKQSAEFQDSSTTYKPPSETPLLKKYNLLIEHLEPKYISQCNNGKELERILKVLRSGEEGFYPYLIEDAERRLEIVKPESKLLNAVCPVITKDELPKEERTEMQRELCKWIEDVKQNDQELSEKKLVGCEDGSECGVRKEREVSGEEEAKSKSDRIRSTDYASWDKFDADAEMLKMDLKDERIKNESGKRLKNKPKKEKCVRFSPFVTEAEAVFEANRQKDIGNELFKAGEYQKALEHYSISITCKPLVPVYTNRAIAKIKLKKYGPALDDCKQALRMDPGNFKARLRMAQAYEGLEKFDEALEFAEKAIMVDPNNTVVQDLAYRMKRKLDKLGGSKRLQILDVESSTKTEKHKGNGYTEVVPIPGTSKMHSPFYKVVKTEDAQKLNAEKRKILKPHGLQYAPTIYPGSDDEVEDSGASLVKNECRALVVKRVLANVIEEEVMEAPKQHKMSVRNSKENGVQVRDKLVRPKEERKRFREETSPTTICDEEDKENCRSGNESGDMRSGLRNINIHNKTDKDSIHSITRNSKDQNVPFTPNKTATAKTLYTEHSKAKLSITIPSKSDLHDPYTFLETWKSISADSSYSLHAEVIRKLDFERIDKSPNMESQMFEDMIICLHKHFMVAEAVQKLHSVLTNLVKIPRFKIMRGFLGKTEVACVGKLIDFLEESDRKLEVDVKKSYLS